MTLNNRNIDDAHEQILIDKEYQQLFANEEKKSRDPHAYDSLSLSIIITGAIVVIALYFLIR